MSTVWIDTGKELPRLIPPSESTFCFAGQHHTLLSYRGRRCACGRWQLVEVPDAPTGSQESAAFWEEI